MGGSIALRIYQLHIRYRKYLLLRVESIQEDMMRRMLNQYQPQNFLQHNGNILIGRVGSGTNLLDNPYTNLVGDSLFLLSN
jgi:hypothetical protein